MQALQFYSAFAKPVLKYSFFFWHCSGWDIGEGWEVSDIATVINEVSS